MRLILRKLCAVLLRSLRGQHSEKTKGSARGNWDPREVQQPFRSNPNGVGDRTTTLKRLLIGEDWNMLVAQIVGNDQNIPEITSCLFFKEKSLHFLKLFYLCCRSDGLCLDETQWGL